MGTVLNIEPILSKDRKTFAGQGKLSHRHVLADCWVVKSSELGLSDDDGTHCRTFLGAMEKMSADKIPDVVLVKKVFGDKALRNRRRKWNLKHMEGFPHMETESANNDLVDFMGDLEEDPDQRQHVNVYRSKLPV